MLKVLAAILNPVIAKDILLNLSLIIFGKEKGRGSLLLEGCYFPGACYFQDLLAATIFLLPFGDSPLLGGSSYFWKFLVC